MRVAILAGKQPGVLTGDPMEYACQQNFELITTDGYWNGTSSNVRELDGRPPCAIMTTSTRAHRNAVTEHTTAAWLELKYPGGRGGVLLQDRLAQ